MLKNLQSVLSVVGIFVQIIGYIAFFRQVADNPIYAVIVLLIGYTINLVICVQWLTKKESRVTSFVDVKNEPVSVTRYVFSKKQRIGAAIILITGTIAAVACIFLILWSARDTGGFSLARIHAVTWTGGGAVAVRSNGNVPLAYIVDPQKIATSTRFTGTACALSFEAEPRSDMDFLMIDGFIVTVENYEPLSPYTAMIPAPFQDENIVYVEIDSTGGRKRVFAAKTRIRDGNISDISSFKIENGKPESFIIRVNARTPGLYTFSISLATRYKNNVDTLLLKPSSKWVFDNEP
jgi:hypothetical protein